MSAEPPSNDESINEPNGPRPAARAQELNVRAQRVPNAPHQFLYQRRQTSGAQRQTISMQNLQMAQNLRDKDRQSARHELEQERRQEVDIRQKEGINIEQAHQSLEHHLHQLNEAMEMRKSSARAAEYEFKHDKQQAHAWREFVEHEDEFVAHELEVVHQHLHQLDEDIEHHHLVEHQHEVALHKAEEEEAAHHVHHEPVLPADAPEMLHLSQARRQSSQAEFTGQLILHYLEQNGSTDAFDLDKFKTFLSEVEPNEIAHLTNRDNDTHLSLETRQIILHHIGEQLVIKPMMHTKLAVEDLMKGLLKTVSQFGQSVQDLGHSLQCEIKDMNLGQSVGLVQGLAQVGSIIQSAIHPATLRKLEQSASISERMTLQALKQNQDTNATHTRRPGFN